MYTLHITSFCWHYVRISIIAITMNTRVPTKDAAIYVYSCVFIVRNVRSIHCSRPLCNVLKSCKHSSLSDTDTQLQLVLWGCLRRRSVLNFPRFGRILHPSCAISRNLSCGYFCEIVIQLSAEHFLLRILCANNCGGN